ncbi:MAG: hypothetical protein EU547_01475 [Promethearchaeota archaeon]|nr:MAG: hypothetical protein EU547_01475 [Candidatus Lokiarchaeota archaeon]
MAKDLKDGVSQLSIITREELVSEIYNDIIMKHHPLFKDKEIVGKKGHSKGEDAPPTDKEFVKTIISNLKKNPAKKVIYLKQFLDNLSDISESDKKVVLKSLESIDIGELEDKMKSLIEIFQLNINE